MEELQRAIGGCGRFQWMMVTSMKLGLVPVSWSMLHMTFGGIIPDWWCLPSSSHEGADAVEGILQGATSSSLSDQQGQKWSRNNVTYQMCDIPGSGGVTCSGHETFDESVTTVVTEWSLVCDQQYLKGLMTSVQMAGVFVGALLAGQTSDTLGRRLTSYASLVWLLVTSLVAAFSVNWQMFMAMRFLIGMAVGSYLVATFPFCFEFVNAKHRQMVSFTPGWILGGSLLALGSWLMPNWRHLHIAAAVLTLPVLLTAFFIPESARWLATKGRLHEAERVIQRVARVNGRHVPQDTMTTLQHVADEEKKISQGHRYTYLDVYRGCRMAITTLILNFLWFSMSLSYYGISFGVSALSGNFHLNLFLMNIIGIPVNLVFVFVANRLGRRWTCFGLYTVCSLSSFGILLVERTVADESLRGTVTTVLAMISKLCVGAGWMTAATLSSELYPTVVRSMGYGSCSTIARVGGALAPVVISMDTADDVVRAYVIVGAIMGLCGVLTLFLRETKGQGLQDSMTVTTFKDTQNQVRNEDKAQAELTELPVWTTDGEKKNEGEKEKDGDGKKAGEKKNEEEKDNEEALEPALYQVISVKL